MKAETPEMSNKLNMFCDTFTISRGWGQKREIHISNFICYCKQASGFNKGLTLDEQPHDTLNSRFDPGGVYILYRKNPRARSDFSFFFKYLFQAEFTAS